MKNKQITISLKTQKKAEKLIPGLTQLLSKRPDRFSNGVWPAYYDRAKGVEVWDLDGNKYIDMSLGGIGANVLGYSDPEVDRAVKNSIDKGTSCSLNCAEEVELAEILCNLHPWAQKVRFARSGGEAMSIAVRIARAFSGKDKIAVCGYHGWHDWYLSANLGGKNALGDHLIPGLEPLGVPRCLAGTVFPFHYNNIKELKDIVSNNRKQLAAIVMEPLRNETPEPEFIQFVMDVASECNAVLVVDEISAGFRLNTGGAHLNIGLVPDIAVFSKALGNGYPIAAVIGRDNVMDAAQKTFISSTAWTERIGPVAAIATIKKHERVNAGIHLVNIGTAVQKGWEKASLTYEVPIEIGGIPPLSHFVMKVPDALAVKAFFVQLMLDQGFLASTSFYSMYAHTEEHVDQYLKAYEKAFEKISFALKKGDLLTHLRGKPSVSGFKRFV